MCERPKVHVFLGAPPPSSGPVSRPGAGGQVEDWRHLELTWQEGRLRPATEDRGRSGDGETSGGRGDSSPRGGWTTEASERLKGDRQRPESSPEKEDQCWSSVHEYLDRCFPAAQPGPGHPDRNQSPAAAPPLSAKTQYLSTWTLSQALILRGKPPAPQTPPSASSSTPELFSPVTPSPRASVELFSPPCPTQRVEEGGVVIQATTDGVLCSQEATSVQTSPSKSPDPKRARVSENLRTAASESTKRQTTPLIRCDEPGARHAVLVAAVHPCHLKEVKVKSGPSAGTLVPLASVVVTDQSGVEMKVVLWRRAAFWALTVSPGDILLLTGLQVNEDRWRGETVLQSTFSSKLLNLGQITASCCPAAPQHVDARSLGCLCDFLRERRPLLLSLKLRPPQDLTRLPYATLRSLRVNTLVHALLRVTHAYVSTAWRREAESRCRSAVQLKAVLTVEQPDGQQGALLLWGAAVDWVPRFNRDNGTHAFKDVWDFHVLLVRDGSSADPPELHSTPWSSAQRLDPADRRARDFNRPGPGRTGSRLELDLDTLLSQKYSGDVELRVHVVAFRFLLSPPSQNAPQLDGSTPLGGVLAALSGDVTYTGCARCSAQLDTDQNGIYCPCYPCLPHTAVRRYYRPGVLMVSGRGHSQACVRVPPGPLQKILEAPADRLHRSSAPGSEVKQIQVAAERIRTLLAPPKKLFIITIRSHFQCDENSVPLDQDFTLLDLQWPS